MRISKTKTLCESKGRICTIDIETDVSKGLYFFQITGNVDRVISESRSRILSALRNTGFDIPQRKNYKISTTFLPTEIPKSAKYCDLAITISYLFATSQIQIENLINTCCLGNITIDGEVYGDLAQIEYLISFAYKHGIRSFILPDQNFSILSNLGGINVFLIKNITDLKQKIIPITIESAVNYHTSIQIAGEGNDLMTLNKIRGLHLQKRALIIAIAGNHPLLFTGQPGTGKTTLAKCCQELIDHLSICELTNIEPSNTAHMFSRPIFEILPNTTPTQLLGNNHVIGKVSAAKNGILLLNELCEFSKKTIDSLRSSMDPDNLTQDKENGPLIIATTNNCPCGMKTNFEKSTEQKCICTAAQIEQYQSKISEPIIDRFPIICNFNYMEQSSRSIGENEKIVKTTENFKIVIHNSRYMQRKRNNGFYNQALTTDEIYSYGITPEAQDYIKTLESIFVFSKRKIVHLLRLARTIADLEKSHEIQKPHLIEAFGYIKTRPFS